MPISGCSSVTHTWFPRTGEAPSNARAQSFCGVLRRTRRVSRSKSIDGLASPTGFEPVLPP